MENDWKYYFTNSFKTSLLINYFVSFTETKDKINEEKNKSNEDILKIKEEKSKNKENSFSINNNAYKVYTNKLLDRYIVNNILRYLIINYPNNFQKVGCNPNICNDIMKNFQKDDDLVNNCEKENKDDIISFIEQTNTKFNNIFKNNSISNDNIKDNTKIKLMNSIKLGNKIISWMI